MRTVLAPKVFKVRGEENKHINKYAIINREMPSILKLQTKCCV